MNYRVAEPRKRIYDEYFKNYDVEKEADDMIKAGVPSAMPDRDNSYLAGGGGGVGTGVGEEGGGGSGGGEGNAGGSGGPGGMGGGGALGNGNSTCGALGYDGVCRDFLRNVCRRGKRCRFRHPDIKEVPDLGVQKNEFIFCHDHQNRQCVRANCVFVHGSQEDEDYYKKTGELPLRLRGKVAAGLGLSPNDLPVSRGEVPMCRDFLKGECQRANKCKFRHVRKENEYETSSRVGVGCMMGVPGGVSTMVNSGLGGTGGVVGTCGAMSGLVGSSLGNYMGMGCPSMNGCREQSLAGAVGVGGSMSGCLSMGTAGHRRFDRGPCSIYDSIFENGLYDPGQVEASLDHAALQLKRRRLEGLRLTDGTGGAHYELGVPASLPPRPVEYRLLEEENALLRKRVEELKKQVSSLLATNDVLLEQNAQFRSQAKVITLSSTPAPSEQSLAPPVGAVSSYNHSIAQTHTTLSSAGLQPRPVTQQDLVAPAGAPTAPQANAAPPTAPPPHLNPDPISAALAQTIAQGMAPPVSMAPVAVSVAPVAVSMAQPLPGITMSHATTPMVTYPIARTLRIFDVSFLPEKKLSLSSDLVDLPIFTMRSELSRYFVQTYEQTRLTTMSQVESEPKNDESGGTVEPEQDSSSGEMDAPKTKLFDAKAILWTFGKCLTTLLPVYLAGYYRMSTSLVAFGMMVYAGWKHTREAKEARLRSAIQLLTDEQEYVSSKSFRSKTDLPSWVNFPDVEKVEWLNKVIHQAWPFIGQYLEKLLTDSIAPAIRGSSAHLQTLGFTKIDFGAKLHGMMRVILEPLIGDVPIVGAVTMFFIQRPKLTINWTGLTNLLDIPGLNVMSDTMIMDAIASFLVLPNRLTVPLVADLPVAQLRCPLPRGVVRIHLLEAADLAAKDNYVKGVMSGMSDPYALVRVGPQTFKSRHLDNTSSPKWGEMYEVIVHEVPGQELEVEVFDKDPDHDDFLGRTKLDLGIVKKSKVIDEWFNLKEAQTGRIHLRLEWLTLEAHTQRLEEVVKRNESVLSKTAEPPSAAILTVYLDKAEALPMKKGNKDPNPIVQVCVQNVTRDSRISWNTVNPQWEDAFTFFIRDPSKQNISVQVKDNDKVQALGNLSIPVSRLLSCPDLSLDEWFSLQNSNPDSRIHISTVLRVLWLDEAAVTSSLLSSEQLSKRARPQKTSPHSSFATEGVLRLHLLEAQDLVAKDNLMGGMVKGKSDPYVKIQIGGETFKSRVVKENLNPTWNEMYEVVLTELPGQELTLEVFDKDMDMKDDFMGRLKMNLSDIISSQWMNEWFPLSGVKRGRVHLVLVWLPTLTQPEKLQQVMLYQSKSSFLNKAVPSAALLFVYLEQAYELPLKKSGKEPKLSHNWDFSLGSVVIPLRELLSEPDLILDQWLDLDGASPQSQILLRAQLKVLFPKETMEMESSEEQRKEPKRPETSSLRRRRKDEEINLKSSIEEVPPPTLSKMSSVSVPEEENNVPEISEVSTRVNLQPLHTTPDPSFAAQGVLRLHLLEAQDLVAKDNLMGGMVKGKSDPYVKIQIGETTFKSHVIKEDLNPTWNEMYEIVTSPSSTSDVLVEVFDKDMDKDDFLGRVKISFQEIIQSHLTDKWFPLTDVKHGRVHLILEWLATETQHDKLEKVLQSQSNHSFQNKRVPSAALFFILLERAQNLPLKKSGKEPRAAAELLLADASLKTKVCERSTSPEWREAFHFLLQRPTEEILIIKISSGFDEPLGSLVLPIRELLSSSDLLMDQWLALDGAGPESRVLLRAQLKILDSRLDSSALEARKAVEERRSTEDRPEDKLLSSAEPPHSAATKTSEKKTLTSKGVSELAASTLPMPGSLPGDPQKHTAPQAKDEYQHSPAAPKSLPTAEDLSTAPDSTTGESERKEPAKTLEEHQKDAAEEQQSHKQPSPCASVEEFKVTSSTDLKPQKTSPDPSFGTRGVLRLHLLEAQDLVAKDNLMGGMVKGKSDPYVKIQIGETTFKSHVIKENLNPTWNEMYEMILSPDPSLELKFEVYDKDVDSDDFLGRFKLRLGDIIRSQYNDEWFPLKDIKHGRVHLVVEWLPTSTHPDSLEPVMKMQSTRSYQNKTVPAAALLFLLLDRAHQLPVCDRTTSPHWNETFEFLVPDPKKDLLIIKLSSAWDQPMGSVVLPIRELLLKPDLLLDQWLSLDGASALSQILLRAQLKILDSKMAGLVAMGSGPVLSNKQTVSTGQIKLSLSFEKKLTVIIHGCRRLVTPSKETLDSYISLVLLPDKNKTTKRKTSVKKKSFSPEFNERFEFDLSLDEAQRRELSIGVKNAASSFMNRDKDLIGQVMIDLGHVDLVSGVSDWFDLKEEQG
ncbi:hypothetical protein DNTS_015755 [Danionella cerebrum]|uniref:Zinc finger CCCH domain-containing protein 10 n=1 Tax=Danionella cerebrum TaxID=2873325 RepID=A0A553MQ20_9TELE|nr:hypothetical protein DNTS_015755 [Danionella translucida]